MALAFGQFVFRTFSRICVYRACREQENDLRIQLMEKVLSYPLARLRSTERGDMITNMIEDTSQVRIFVGFGFVQFFNIMLVYLVSIPIMYQISPKLTLLSCLPYPFLLIFIAWMNQRLYYLNLEVKEKLADVTEFSSQVIHGIHVAKSFNAFDGLKREFAKLNDRHFQTSWSTTLLEVLLLPGMIFLASLGEFMILRYGSEMIQNGQITYGDFLAFHGYIGYILFASISVGFGMSTFNRGYTSYKRLNDRFMVPGELLKSEDQKFRPKTMEFRNFSYRYEGAQERALELENLKLPMGKMIGLCGPIGSGKSTFFNLVQGLEDRFEGEFLLDGESMTKALSQKLRNISTSVFQEIFLFSDSVAQNVEFYSGADLDTVKKALRFANLEQDIAEFENGMETIVGEKGVRLSLGQKQRLSIARAVCQGGQHMIFDDCFSALDTVTEEKILQNLLKLKEQKKTLFLASHRVSTLKHCDLILVFKKGQLIEQGSHAELLDQKGYYSEIDEIQRSFSGETD